MDEQNYFYGNSESGNNDTNMNETVYVDNTNTSNTSDDNASAYSYSYTDNNNYQDYTGTYNANAYTENSGATTSETPGTAIVALIMGVMSIMFSCSCGLGIVFGIVGVITGIIGNKSQPTGVGKAGLICSIIGSAVSLLGIVFYVVYFFIMLASS